MAAMKPVAYRQGPWPSQQMRPPWLEQSLNDDHEPWYTQPSPSNRMLLALRSGIDTEIQWALERLLRLARNEKFLLKTIPGLVDALFEWPEWFVDHWNEGNTLEFMFSPDPVLSHKKRCSLESLLVLRNAALNEVNAQELASHPRTRYLILTGLHRFQRASDSNSEFLLHLLDLLFSISGNLVLAPSTPPSANPIKPLEEIARNSQNRTLIISALQTLSLILANPANAAHLSQASSALDAAIQYLPLFKDKLLLATSLEFIYTYLSNAAMTRAFLFHPELTGMLRVLVALLLSEQDHETVTVDLTSEAPTVTGSSPGGAALFAILPDELETLAATDEPERSHEWMKAVFIPASEGELTQVEFWTLYRETFAPFAEQKQLLIAAELIKNVTIVFPQTQAMVLPGPPQRFVIRGIAKRHIDPSTSQFKCQWAQTMRECESFESAEGLCKHVQEHLTNMSADETVCPWSSCGHSASSKGLRRHIPTHLPSPAPKALHPEQPDTVTSSSALEQFPATKPTTRPVPAAPKTVLTYRAAKAGAEPPSTSLTALLIIRILFRTSFASRDLAPRADADHIGFPGTVEEDAEEEERPDIAQNDLEGERRGRKAFVGVRGLMQSVSFADPVLQEWILEMVDRSLTSE